MVRVHLMPKAQRNDGNCEFEIKNKAISILKP